MGNKGGNIDNAMVTGPSADDSSSGIYLGPSSGRSKTAEGKHGMGKGAVVAARGKTYTPSTIDGGDKGGSAGGYGVGHGLGPTSKSDAAEGIDEMPSYGYRGQPMMFEGGVRGGGVSAQETMPAMYPNPKKTGYNEQSPSRPGNHSQPEGGAVHGVAGAEGIPGGAGGDMEGSSSGGGSEGFAGHSCPHGCGMTTKSSHGLARHVKSAHGGFGGLGKAMAGGLGGVAHATTHGDSYTGKQTRGETEGPKEWEANEHEWKAAKDAAASGSSSSQEGSAYDRGDRGGSYGNV